MVTIHPLEAQSQRPQDSKTIFLHSVVPFLLRILLQLLLWGFVLCNQNKVFSITSHMHSLVTNIKMQTELRKF